MTLALSRLRRSRNRISSRFSIADNRCIPQPVARVVYCKAPFAGPKQVLRYLSRYTHRVAISNRRLIAADDAGVTFRWKDYCLDGPGRWKTMRLHPHEFIRRFLLHVLPRGFHRIRHYGLFANANRADNIATARAFLDVAQPAADPQQQSDITPEGATPAALPMPALRRPHDRDPGVRIRPPAEVAADAKHNRHVMSQTSSERRRFLVPLRWIHAGGDLSRLDSRRSIHPAPVDTLQALAETPFSRSRPPCLQASRSPRPSVAPTSELGANIKSP